MVSLIEVEPRALELPENDRLVLAARLLLSVEPPADQTIEDAWSREIQKRLSEVDQGRVEGIPGELALARLRKAARSVQ
jgi:putative addiction module component (TIGR02574 family)